MTRQLFTCIACQWIFRRKPGTADPCPKCGNPTAYGARRTHGPICYQWEKTQEPWLKSEMSIHEWKLRQQVGQANAARDPADLFHAKGA